VKKLLGILLLSILVSFTALVGCTDINNSVTKEETVQIKVPRLQPLAESELNDKQLKILTPLKVNGKNINIFATAARNPEMLDAWNSFGMYILKGSTLPARDRELLILRTGWLTRCEYEFGQHTLIAKQIGLTSEEINRITKGPDEPGWDSFDAALLRAADELHAESVITDPTWKDLAQRYNEKQLIDVVMTVGQYNMVSMFLNTNKVPLDEGTPGFPE